MFTTHSLKGSDQSPGSSESSATEEIASPGDALRRKWQSKFLSRRLRPDSAPEDRKEGHPGSHEVPPPRD